MLRYANVRHRLTLWYVGVFGLMLLLFIFAATLLQYWQLTRQLYHAEIQDIETAEGLLAFAPDGRLVLHEEYHNHPQSILLLDRYMEVLTPDGRVLLRNDKLQGQDLGGRPFPGEGLSSYHQRRIRLADGTRLLLISHIHAIGSQPLLIRLAYSAAPIEHGVLQFVALLLLAVHFCSPARPVIVWLAKLCSLWIRWRCAPRPLRRVISTSGCPSRTPTTNWGAWLEC
jgi:hypothetical protein